MFMASSKMGLDSLCLLIGAVQRMMKVLCNGLLLAAKPVWWICDLLLPGANVKHTKGVHMGAYRGGELSLKCCPSEPSKNTVVTGRGG